MKTNLTKRIVGLLVSLSLTLTYAVPFAFAEGGVSAETLESVETLLGEAEATLAEDTDSDGLTIQTDEDAELSEFDLPIWLVQMCHQL